MPQAAAVSGTAAWVTDVAEAYVAVWVERRQIWHAESVAAKWPVFTGRQDAACGPPPYGRAEDTPLRYARTLASGASSSAPAWHHRCDHPRHFRHPPTTARVTRGGLVSK